MSEPNQDMWEGFCVMELFGHRKLAGYVRPVTLAGGAFLRLDVPADDGDGNAVTQFYAPAAVFSISPCSEDVARRFARTTKPEPVTRWELPAPKRAKAAAPDEPDRYEDDDDERDDDDTGY